MGLIFRVFERGFTILSLMIYSGGFLSLIKSGGASQGDADFFSETDSTLVLLIFQLIYVITFVLLILRWKKIIYTLQRDKILWILVGLSVASILWSLDPRITFVRCIALIGTSLFGLYLATRYSLEEQLQILGWTFGTIIVFSLISVFLLPKYGIMAATHAGAWRGIYNHKNVLGKMMVLSSLIFLLQTNMNFRRKLTWVGLSLSIILLLLAKSSAAIVSFSVMVVVFMVVKTFRWRYELMVPALLAVLTSGAGILIVLTNYVDVLFKLIGKDPTLTGRTDFWVLLLDNVWKHFWWGCGYGAFWQESNSDAALIRYAVGWSVPNAHNGFLDLWLDLGTIGVLTFFISLLGTIVWTCILLRRTKKTIYIWPLLFISNLALANLTESTLMVRNDIFWVIYVAIVFSIQALQEDNSEQLKENRVGLMH
jgi:exopolysaccharide production protein ExoQ